MAKKATPETPARDYRRAADLLKQASDPTRLQILQSLALGERNVTDLVSELDGMSQPACSHHIALLRHGGLIAPMRRGKFNFYQITDAGRRLHDSISALAATA